MERYAIQQRFLIVKYYYLNGKSLLANIRKLYLISVDKFIERQKGIADFVSKIICIDGVHSHRDDFVN